MTNLFDSAEYPEVEPETLVIGDRWTWKRTDLTDYATDTYALTYAAVLHGPGRQSIAITASESGNDYIVEVAAATTVTYKPGSYDWAAYITRSSDSERIRIGQGTWLVRPDAATSLNDPRTFNRRVLDAIRATIEGRASQAHSSYSIEGRSVSRMSPEELERWHGIYMQRVAAEQQTIRAREGRRTMNTLRARF